MHQDEEHLVRRAQDGEMDAFAVLYDRYFDRIYRYVKFKLGNAVEAEDVTGQVFLKALEALHKFRWRGTPYAAWLFRIAHNQVVDYHRWSNKMVTEEISEFFPAPDLDPQILAVSRFNRQELLQAVDKLTELQRQVIALRFAGGLSIAETAALIGKSEGAVKAFQHSGLAALQRLLAPKFAHSLE